MPLMMLPSRPVFCDGLTARLHSAGEGPDLVLLPSMLVLDLSYQWLIPVLARRFRVHVVQLPGSGRASRLRRAWSFQRYGMWLTWFMEELRLDRPVLVGHSNSGAAALIAAAERPDLFSRLVLVDTAGFDPDPSLLRVLAGRALDAAIEWKLSLWGFHHVLFNAAMHTRNSFGQIRAAAGPRLVRYARENRVPTLLAWGRRDHTMPLRHAQEALRAFPNAEMYVCEMGSHDWLITNSEEFANAVGSFCGIEEPGPTPRDPIRKRRHPLPPEAASPA